MTVAQEVFCKTATRVTAEALTTGHGITVTYFFFLLLARRRDDPERAESPLCLCYMIHVH